MLFFNTLFLIVFGILCSFIISLGVTSLVLYVIFSSSFPKIRKSIYLDDVHSMNKLIESLNE